MSSPTDASWQPEAGEILSVGDLMACVRGVVEQQFSWVWVEGEVSNLRIPSSGHAYFTLLDDRAQVRAVCFRSTLRLLTWKPENGQRVLARGRVTVYEPRGDVQLMVEDLEPEGEGLQRLAFEALKRKLAEEGLFAADRKRELPPLPRAVGVVSSASGAALQDILQVLGRRAPGVDVWVSAARVQGEGAARDLIRALEHVQSRAEVDVVILGRGGGAAEDLWAFNDENLVRAVAACRVPVISAVGHEIDDTLCDLAADVRAPTPSAAAELAVREWQSWLDHLRELETRLERAQQRLLERLRARLQRLDPWLRSPVREMERLTITVDRLAEILTAQMQSRLHRFHIGLRSLERRLEARSPARRLTARSADLNQLLQRLGRAMENRISCERNAVQRFDAQLSALNPMSVLDRGYAIVRKTGGQVVRNADSCVGGERLHVRLRHGGLVCSVEDVQAEGREGIVNG